MSKLSDYFIEKFSPGQANIRYKIWVGLSLIVQVVFCLTPTLLDRPDSIWTQIFLFGTIGVTFLLILIRTAAYQKTIAFILTLYGLSLCFILIASDLTNPGILIYLFSWSMGFSLGYSREYFNVKQFIAVMSSVLIFFALSLLFMSTTDYSLLDRLYSIGSGTVIIATNIFMLYREVGKGKNHYSESRKRYDDISYLSVKMQEILSTDEKLETLFLRVSKESIPILILDNCTIFLYDNVKEKLVANDHKNADLEIPIGETVIAKSYQTQEPILISEIELTKYQPYGNGQIKYKSEIAVPIFSDGIVVGVLGSRHPDKNFFRDRHFQAFNVIASFCGIKITQENAKKSILTARHSEEEMKRYKELDELKNRFITNISHDLKTPLSLIKAPAKQILETSNDPKIKVLSKYVLKNADHLLRVVHQLLQLNRVDKGLNELIIQEFNLGLLIEKVCGQYEIQAETQKINFEISTEPIIICTDIFRLEQIIHNLLSNAFRYTKANGNIKLIAKSDGEFVKITIADDGEGILKELQDKVFDRFYKVDANNHEGTGIGLSLVKEYTAALGGTVALTSELGKGTTFHIQIPIKSEDVAPVKLTKGANWENEFEKDLEFNDSKPIMLVVEDHVDLNAFICSCFEDKYHCISASDGVDALSKAIKQIPDIIITDLMMPNMNGNELVGKLKENETTAHIPIIVLTAKSQIESKIDLYEIGADNYLLKPFEIGELHAIVKNTLKQRRMIRDLFYKKLVSSDMLNDGLSIVENEIDEKSKLLIDARNFVMENIDNERLSVVMMAKNIGIGRNRLQIEIKELTDLTPVEFIRSIRLNEAKLLLGENKKSVSEVAYSVGFNSLSYFSRSFKTEFDVLPSEWQLESN